MGTHYTLYSLTKTNPTWPVGDRWLSVLFESQAETLLRVFWHRIQDLMSYNRKNSPLRQRGSYKIKDIHLNSTVNVNSYEKETFTKYVVDYTVLTVFYLRTIKKKKKKHFCGKSPFIPRVVIREISKAVTSVRKALVWSDKVICNFD